MLGSNMGQREPMGQDSSTATNNRGENIDTNHSLNAQSSMYKQQERNAMNDRSSSRNDSVNDSTDDTYNDVTGSVNDSVADTRVKLQMNMQLRALMAGKLVRKQLSLKQQKERFFKQQEDEAKYYQQMHDARMHDAHMHDTHMSDAHMSDARMHDTHMDKISEQNERQNITNQLLSNIKESTSNDSDTSSNENEKDRVDEWEEREEREEFDRYDSDEYSDHLQIAAKLLGVTVAVNDYYSTVNSEGVDDYEDPRNNVHHVGEGIGIGMGEGLGEGEGEGVGGERVYEQEYVLNEDGVELAEFAKLLLVEFL